MPIYEYQCQACKQQFEKLQKISDEPLVDCPDCEQPALKKMVSASAFRLKGAGWYETDFKTGNKKNLKADANGNSNPATKPASPTKDNAQSSKDTGSEKSAPKNKTA